MPGPFVLFLISLAGVGIAFIAPGARDLLLLAGPCALASLWLLLRASASPQARSRPRLHDPDQPGTRRPRGAALIRHPIVIDGSNVLYWKENIPDIGALIQPGLITEQNQNRQIARAGKYGRQHRSIDGRLRLHPQHAHRCGPEEFQQILWRNCIR